MFEDKETRDKKISLRVTGEERDFLVKLSKKRNFKNVSDYIRFLIQEDTK